MYCFLDKNANKLPSLWEPSCREIGQFCAAASEPSKNRQGQASVLLHTNHWWQKKLFEDPEVLLAAELGSWPWRLQEQAHGASAQVLSQWGAQSGCRKRPHQPDDVELDSSNKAEAACQVVASSKPTSVPTLGMSLQDCFSCRNIRSAKTFSDFLGNKREMDPWETTRKNEILFYWTSTYVVRNNPSMDVLRNKPKRIILLVVWNAIGPEILADFVVK